MPRITARLVVVYFAFARLAPNRSDLPGSLTERAAPPPLFGLAPRGVYPARRITPPAVRSYRTISPLPAPLLARQPRRYIFCGTFRENPFERSPPAVSRHAALWRLDFPLARLEIKPRERLSIRPLPDPSLSWSTEPMRYSNLRRQKVAPAICDDLMPVPLGERPRFSHGHHLPQVGCIPDLV